MLLLLLLRVALLLVLLLLLLLLLPLLLLVQADVLLRPTGATVILVSAAWMLLPAPRGCAGDYG